MTPAFPSFPPSLRLACAAVALALLAGCAGAPMMVINGHYHERLTLDQVDALLDGLE